MSVSLEGSTQDVELNLAPIIDCFTVLITYLLVTASFLTLTALDVGVSANNPTNLNTPPPPPPKEPPMTMTVDLTALGEVKIKVSGGTLPKDFESTIKASSIAGTWDADQLEKSLTQIKTNWSNLTEASVSAEAAVKYKEIVNLINQIQKSLPKVYISGG